MYDLMKGIQFMANQSQSVKDWYSTVMNRKIKKILLLKKRKELLWQIK